MENDEFEDENLTVIADILKKAKRAIDIDAIASRLKKKISKRTLQRRVANLVKLGIVVTIGQGKALQYKFNENYQLNSTKNQSAQSSSFAPSKKGAEISLLVQRPLQSRIPVSYKPTFLKSYIPNTTRYLPLVASDYLKKQGSPNPAQQMLPAGTFARKILDRLLIDLSWSSSRLEGNTYSLLETEELLRFGRAAEGKNSLEAQMIINHKTAVEFLVESAAEIDFNRYTIFNLHAILADGLLNNPSACGRIRDISVGIGGSVYYPLEVPQQIEEHFDTILRKASAILDPFEQALFAMIHLPYLQPFEDVNKRVSRIAANIPFIKQNFSPLSFIDIPEKDYVNAMLAVYELNRTELLRDLFIWAYERSVLRYNAIRSALGEPDPFRVKYLTLLREAVAGVVRSVIRQELANGFIVVFSEKNIPAQDRTKFQQLVQLELANLHEGNFARFQIRPSEYEKWKNN